MAQVICIVVKKIVNKLLNEMIRELSLVTLARDPFWTRMGNTIWATWPSMTLLRPDKHSQHHRRPRPWKIWRPSTTRATLITTTFLLCGGPKSPKNNRLVYCTALTAEHFPPSLWTSYQLLISSRMKKTVVCWIASLQASVSVEAVDKHWMQIHNNTITSKPIRTMAQRIAGPEVGTETNMSIYRVT